MQVPFFKYQGNGNDFVIIDNRQGKIKPTSDQIRKLCDRHFGVGADGVMLLQLTYGADFEMVYYNSDGNVSSMCGNGGRCLAAFAYSKGIVSKSMRFVAFDGLHKAIINEVVKAGKIHDVSITMGDVEEVEHDGNFYFLDIGSPHYVEFVDKVSEIDVVKEGRKTRKSYRFAPDGTNVNFVEISDDRIFVRTYERGVEDETLSCGTGVTASAIAAYLETGKKDLQVHTTGGDFKISFEEEKGVFKSIWLRGPAELVFEGEVNFG